MTWGSADENQGSATIRSYGEPSARGYAVMTFVPSPPRPLPVLERVLLVRPSETPTRTGPLAGSGPRNPEQRRWPPPTRPSIDLPDRRPLIKAQRFWIDPELLARWDAEEASRRSTRT